mgnify:FL=1
MCEVKTGAPIEVPNLLEKMPTIPCFKFGESILNEDPCKVNVFWSMTGSPMTQWPNTTWCARL